MTGNVTMCPDHPQTKLICPACLGSAKSERKTASARINGSKAGRNTKFMTNGDLFVRVNGLLHREALSRDGYRNVPVRIVKLAYKSDPKAFLGWEP